MDPKRLVIIDGYSLLYRAFFATRYLSTSDGRPTNALFGFTSMLFYILENVKPDAIVVAFDAPGKTFRHAEYPEYKATRKETQEELKVQLPEARGLIEALGIPSFELTGFEADDIVGTISKLAEENGYETTIVTGDLDSLQLVDDHVSVLTTRQGVTDTVTYDPEAVEARYGFGPEYITDYKALVGDTSDNIPGVPGIGAKSAAILIEKFGSIENMLEHFDEVEPKFQKKIAGNEEQIPLSKSLATIKRDVDINYDFEPFKLTPQQFETAEAMLERFEFRSHLRRARGVLGPYVTVADGEEEFVSTEVEDEKLEVKLEDVKDLGKLSQFVGSKPYAVFFGGPPPKPAESLFDEEAERLAYVAIERQVKQVPESLAADLIKQQPKQAILHDAKPYYKSFGEWVDTPRFDTMLAGFVLQSGRSNYMLRDLVQGYLDFQVPTKPEEMAAALYYVEQALADRLKKEEQYGVFEDIEMPLIPILAEMENTGIATDRQTLKEFSKTLEVTIEQTTQKIHEMAGEEFNIGSPKQLGVILFEKMGIPGVSKTKTGYSTGAEVLQLLAPSHPICSEILSWRELTKLKSTYADSLEKLIRADGRIHTTYNQTGAATGRLSSNDPNLQNIPIRTELGRGIRKAFHAEKGYRLLSLDYSQIELRLLAHLCEDEALVEAFQKHEDVHAATAQKIFNIEPDMVSKEQRRLAKMLNYAVLYGVTDFGLANQLGGGFSIAEAKELITAYFERFHKVKEFTESVIAEARSKGFTTTLRGRRRYFPDIHAAKVNERRAAERQAINAPIQGAAADMLKIAMINTHKKLGDSTTRMLLNVHDELVFELADGEDSLIDPLRTEMENALPLSVPIEVDAKVGADWNDMTVIETARV